MVKQKTSQPEYLKLLSNLKLHDHVCLIYEEGGEQLSEIVPFVKMGIERNEKCVYVADENTVTAVVDTMKKSDKQLFTKALEEQHLILTTKKETYLKGDRFDVKDMITMLKSLTEGSIQQGYSGYRGTGEMTWVLGSNVDPATVIEYEMELNTFVANHEACILCQYNSKKFSKELLLQVFLTHPKVIYRNQVFENPIFYSRHEMSQGKRPGDQNLTPKDLSNF